MKCSFTDELKIYESISHIGVCLTVVEKEGDNYTVTAIKDTLDKSNLGLLKLGDKVNLERSVRLDGRLDGHMVQGHVDQTAVCTEVMEAECSWYYTFEYEPAHEYYINGKRIRFGQRRKPDRCQFKTQVVSGSHNHLQLRGDKLPPDKEGNRGKY